MINVLFLRDGVLLKAQQLAHRHQLVARVHQHGDQRRQAFDVRLAGVVEQDAAVLRDLEGGFGVVVLHVPENNMLIARLLHRGHDTAVAAALIPVLAEGRAQGAHLVVIAQHVIQLLLHDADVRYNG